MYGKRRSSRQVGNTCSIIYAAPIISGMRVNQSSGPSEMKAPYRYRSVADTQSLETRVPLKYPALYFFIENR
jgi:hypothetical protein